jgi:hypothetical protein
MAGLATVGEVARGPASVPGLWVIPPGADPSLAEYHLQHDTAKALTNQLRRDARYVIIEAQATADGADTFTLADFADTALLAIESNQTRRVQVSDVIRRLHRIRVPLLGSVLVTPLSRQMTIRPPQPASPGPVLTPAGHTDTSSALTSSDPRPPTRPRAVHGDPADPIPGR